jgi:type II secretory pathway component PulK
MIAPAPFRSSHTRRRGIMLVLVLWVVTILSLLMYSLLFNLTLETRITSVRKKTVQAKAIARAGLAKGFVDLRNDLIADFSDETIPAFDAEGDYWAKPEEGKDDEEFGDGNYTVTIEDQERFLSLRALSPTNRILLEKLIEEIGYNEDDAKIAAAAIIDFADEDEAPVLDSAPETEAIAYGLLKAEDEGIRADEDDVVKVIFPNEAYLTVETLLEVYGVTPDLYFGPETPEAIYYNNLLAKDGKKRRDDRFRIENKRQRFDSDLERNLGLRDFFTADSNGQVNLNTAPKHVLMALFLAAGRDDADRAADDVIRYRRGGKDRRIDNDSAFTTVDDFSKLDTLASVLGPLQAIHPLGVRSEKFLVRSRATYGSQQTELAVLVSRELIQIQRDESFEALDRQRERLERFDDRRKRWEDKDDELLIRIPSIYVVRWLKP